MSTVDHIITFDVDKVNIECYIEVDSVNIERHIKNDIANIEYCIEVDGVNIVYDSNAFCRSIKDIKVMQ